MILLTPKPPSNRTFCKVPESIVTSRIDNYLSRSMAAALIASVEDEDGFLGVPLAT
jgi:hypothetical protein